MKTVSVILKKEWNNFLGSERGVFAIYGVLVLSWSLLPLSKDLAAGPVWWLFFSVIISGNFAATVFVSERLNGSMEILLTSGFPRNAVLFGKVAFITLISTAIGGLCFCCALWWLHLSGRPHALYVEEVLMGAGLYCAGTIMNVACGAWMSIRLQSPRIIPFISILFMAAVVAAYYGLSYLVAAPQWTLIPVLAVAAAFFLHRAKKEFNGEKVIQPITL